MSPLTANRPGRLASFRPERDLTLGASSSAGAAGGVGILGTPAKTKKIFAPTIPTRRGKNPAETPEKFEDKFQSDR